MDLSKTYDCLPHGLLISKLEAYGFGMNSLRLLYSYLTHSDPEWQNNVINTKNECSQN